MDELPDYIYDEARIQEALAELDRREQEVSQEMDGADDLDLGLDGPQRAAGIELSKIARSKARLEAALDRTRNGFLLWERWGFEHTITCACGEHLSWEEISEALTSGISSGNPSALVRMPLEIQGAYAKAHLTGLFRSFTVATSFDSDELMDDLTGKTELVTFGHFSYLFGLANSEDLSNEDLFHIASWKSIW